MVPITLNLNSHIKKKKEKKTLNCWLHNGVLIFTCWNFFFTTAEKLVDLK